MSDSAISLEQLRKKGDRWLLAAEIRWSNELAGRRERHYSGPNEDRKVELRIAIERCRQVLQERQVQKKT